MYCSFCGQPNAHTTKKPKFCNECGESFGTSKAKTTPAKKIPQEPMIIEESEDECETSGKMPNLRGLDVEIESSEVKGVKLGEIVDAAMEAPLEEMPERAFPKQKGRRKTKKARQEFLDNWKKEAGAIRKQ